MFFKKYYFFLSLYFFLPRYWESLFHYLLPYTNKHTYSKNKQINKNSGQKLKIKNNFNKNRDKIIKYVVPKKQQNSCLLIFYCLIIFKKKKHMNKNAQNNMYYFELTPFAFLGG